MTYPAVDLPPEKLRAFRIDLFRGHYAKAVKVIEEKGMDINSVLDPDDNDTLLFTCARGFSSRETPEKIADSLKLMEYLLSRGANPNIKSRRSNAFHIALYAANLELCELFMQYDVEVNAVDEYGSTTLLSFLISSYPELAWKGVPVKKRSLAIIEEMLKRGADPAIENNRGTTAKEIRCREIQSVLNLLEKYEALNIEKAVPSKENSVSKLKYPEICTMIWDSYVPKRGQSETVQGELLRSIEKLRDEAHRNGNGNYHDGHRRMAGYLRDTLLESGIFTDEIAGEIRRDSKKLTYKTAPYLKDDIYDRFCDRICEFQLHHNAPVQREFDPELGI